MWFVYTIESSFSAIKKNEVCHLQESGDYFTTVFLVTHEGLQLKVRTEEKGLAGCHRTVTEAWQLSSMESPLTVTSHMTKRSQTLPVCGNAKLHDC